MSDLISRGKMLEAARHIRKSCDTNDIDDFYSILVETIKVFPSAQLGTNLAEVGTDCISRQAAIDALKKAYWDKDLQAAKDDPCVIDAMTDWAIRQIKALPSATQQETISEDYAKAVRNWLVHYQVKCVELQGRYTPYEVLGWVVSDWRRENEIW